MIQIAICDDEKCFTAQIEELLLSTAKREGIEVECSVFFDGSSLLHYMQEEQKQFDIIFLDIEMEYMDGIKTAREIRKFDEDVVLIYITSYEEYALEAYDVQPFHFLLKPIKEEKYEECFLKATKRITGSQLVFSYSANKRENRIFLTDILYFESNRRKIIIHTKEACFSFYGKLDMIETELKKKGVAFCRVHQSFLVNMYQIKQKSYDRIRMSNEEYINVSEKWKGIFNLRYMEMVNEL